MSQKAYIPVIIGCVIVLVTWLIVRYRYLGDARQARAALTADRQYHDLADEYRRLSDLAITAQEHTDLRLTELSVRIEELRGHMEQLRHILKEVE
jgi:phage shock protein A